jgi:hypothetical protein
LLIKDFGQQHINGGADWSATEGGQVLPHFQQIVSGASTPPFSIVAVIKFLCGQLLVVGHWSLVVGHWSLVVGHWSLVVGCWSMVVGRWSLVVGHWSLVIGHWLLVVGCWLWVLGCWLLVAGQSTIRVPELWEVSLQKDKGSRALGGFPLKG